MNLNHVDLINKYDSIVIFGHKSPDGDCYGSQVALKETILATYPNKKAYIVGSGLPNFFEVISPMDNVDDEVIKNSLAIIVDGNDLERMEDERVFTALAFCKFDHHIDMGTFTNGPSIVDENANSTCSIILKFIRENNFKITPKICNALYLGILTDSGRFQFTNDYIETFNDMAFLCQNGAEPKQINRTLEISSRSSLECKKYVFSNIQESKNGVLYVVFPRTILNKLGVNHTVASSMINLYGNIKGSNIWAAFSEYSDGRLKIEVRSNGPEIQSLCASIGGGGHKLAAGVSVDKFDINYINDFVDRLDKILYEWKKNN